ncbi:DUF2069 domain-containing protein [Rubrivivax rivuli]|uniref:DUF2069 domain-containing protein n=1 Tax=Rubrivivax rivuli TaxID=1862385 RepID=A0A437REV2_9BURK|nr:DUF2069 domain-containing protein [Rubrivivax rivuli]RVU45252.1 DUF2069 domain-containing protein [Rubrivivax rivuli]
MPSASTPDDTPPRAPDAIVRSTRAAALAALLALIALGLAWELWLAPTGSGTLALKVLPLVFCLAGLLRHRMYTFRWLSLLVWLYFMEGVVRATTESGVSQLMAVLEIVLSLVLFIVSGIYIRWRQRNGAALAAAEKAKAAGEAAA